MRKDSTLVRTLLGLVVALLLLLASWGAVHRVRGGAELPLAAIIAAAGAHGFTFG
jgi:hypothetical protein